MGHWDGRFYWEWWFLDTDGWMMRDEIRLYNDCIASELCFMPFLFNSLSFFLSFLLFFFLLFLRTLHISHRTSKGEYLAVSSTIHISSSFGWWSAGRIYIEMERLWTNEWMKWHQRFTTLSSFLYFVPSLASFHAHKQRAQQWKLHI